MSNQESEFKSVDEKADYDIVHFLKLGKANGFASKPLNPGPQSQMFALDLLCIPLANLVLFLGKVALVGTPVVSEEPGDSERLQKLFQLQENHILAVAKHVGEDSVAWSMACQSQR